MSTRSDLVISLAPSAPPCFSARDQWLEYLSSAAEAAKRDYTTPGPIVMVNGKAQFNYTTFNICVDCCAKHSLAMSRQGLCQPGYLKALGSLATLARQVAPMNYQRVSA